MALYSEKYIKVNQWSRPAQKITDVRKVVIHYTANNGATAMNHYNYFNNLTGRYASAHFFVDKNEALLIVPLNEITYHANDGSTRKIAELKPNANYLSIGIEMCLESNGTFHPNTIARTEDIAVHLCKKYGLNPLKDIVRHYDITGKNCPAPWISNSQLFVDFKNRTNAKFNGLTEKAEQPKQPEKPKDVYEVGDKGERVEYFQKLLQKLSYKIYVDGIFSTLMESHVKDFQSKNGLVQNGKIGLSTLPVLEAEAKKAEEERARPSLQYGNQGIWVGRLQGILIVLGYKMNVTENFDHTTENAVIDFQKKNGLGQGGVVGTSTWEKLVEQRDKIVKG